MRGSRIVKCLVGAALLLFAAGCGAATARRVNHALGLTQTTIGTDGFFGLTTTTTSDQIRLLRHVFTSASVLTPASRDYIRCLMSHVEPAQSFGVSAAASPGTTVELKDGYLPNRPSWRSTASARLSAMATAC